MNDLLEFLSFSDPNVRVVTLGTIFLGMSAAMVGTFTFLRKRSLVGDAVAHAILPGVALAFMMFHSKNPLVLMSGALVSGWMAMLLIEHLANKTKLKADTTIALVLSVFFGVGILLLTSIQHSGAGNQAGLDQFLFGKAASITRDDMITYSIVALALLLVIVLLYKEFKLLSFNRDFAIASGLPVRGLQFILSTITVLAISIGIQAVGVVLMAALLITPSATARVWTDKLWVMIILAGVAGSISGFTGSYISFTAPNMPTGPWVVVSLSLLAIISLFLAPQNGIITRLYKQRKNKLKIHRENLLKTFYHLNEKTSFERADISIEELRNQRSFRNKSFRLALRELRKSFLIVPIGNKYRLSERGMEEAKRVVRLHRLWEMYLTQRMRLKSDHIHPSAETMEHIITPEIEQQLLQELDYPELDPHQSPIPYKK